MEPNTVKLALSIVLTFVAAGCPGRRQGPFCELEAPRPSNASYAIGGGDVLQVNVWQNAELSGQVTVRPDGFITMPLLGDVRAAGLPPAALQEDLTRALGRFVNAPSVTVSVTEIASYRIYVLGQVAEPAELTPRRPVTVLQALSLVGGLTRFADPDGIVIVRRTPTGECRIPFAFSDVVDEGRLEQNIPLVSGDTVFVP